MEAARTGAARLFGGIGSKRTRSDSTSTAGGSAAGRAGQTAAASSGTGPLNPQQRSFAQAAGGSSGKRPTPALPSCPRPQLRRGPAVLQHQDYLSMERPAPATPAPNTLYLNMRTATISPEDALEAAFDVLGNAVLGFQLFAAQKVLALTFAFAETYGHYRNQPLGPDGPVLYPAPSKPANLVRLTLQGIPYWNKAGILAQLPTLLAPYSELVFLAPMVTARGWLSDQWHATIARKEGVTDLPPDTIQLCDVPVIVDIPGQRRYCRHCASSTHYKSSCRQWQRQRSRQAQAAREQAAHDAASQPQAHQQPRQLQQHPNQQSQQQLDRPQQTLHEMWAQQLTNPFPSRRSAFTDTDAMETENEAAIATHVACARAILAEASAQDPQLVQFARDFLADVAGTGDSEQ
jgi:hypothetical protein